MPIEQYLIWGMLGAFVYAAPKFVVAAFEEKVGGRSHWRHVAELMISLPIGLIAAGSMGPELAQMLHHSSHEEARALAVLLGLIANPIAPAIVSMVSDHVLRRLGAPLRRPTQ